MKVHALPFFAKSYHVVIADSRAQGRCYVIGWSDGGINGLLMAIRHPDKVKRLAVTGANLWPDTTAVNKVAYTWAMSMNAGLIKKNDTSFAGRTQRKLMRLFSYEPNISISQLHTIGCPTLVIGGDHDVILPQHTLLIAQNIPHAYCWILPNSGHSTPIFYKDDFNRTVQNFFTKPFRSFAGFMFFQ